MDWFLPWGIHDYQLEGFPVSNLCRWGPSNEDIQRLRLSVPHRTENGVH